MLKHLFWLALIFALYHVVERHPGLVSSTTDQIAQVSQRASVAALTAAAPEQNQGGATPTGNDALFRTLFETRRSEVQVMGSGRVSSILTDDNTGSRHQRFILRLDSGQSLLVAHNIDLAPRIAGLSHNDLVIFQGEYAWNAEGGVIHWTHHDPAGRHVPGWLSHDGRTYQ